MNKPAILVIGGLDPQGGAGLVADIQTATMQGCHPIPLPTCLTEQTSKGLTQLGALSKSQFMAQYQCCDADVEIAAIKVGLIPNSEIAHCISNIIEQHDVPVILDPVLASTSGGVTVSDDVEQIMLQTLLPKVTILTPNLPELAKLTALHQEISELQVEIAVQQLLGKGLQACLVKGGHADDAWASDYFKDGQHEFYCYQTKQAKNVRGTGCVLATSLACQLALEHDRRDAIVLAKAYISRGIRLSNLSGPYYLFHHSMTELQLEDVPKLCYDAKLIGQQFQFSRCPDRLGIYPVVENSDWVNKLVTEGIKTIQLRIKHVSDEVKQQQIAASVAYCDDDVAFFVNDYWQMAIDNKAYGIHLGQEDLHDANLLEIEKSGCRLGISTHSYWELARALAINPSYIALGPVFETTSKQMPFEPQGIERVAQWTRLLAGHYPLVAIGGIDLARAKALKQTAVGSVAMISAITKANDYRQATQALIACWQQD